MEDLLPETEKLNLEMPAALGELLCEHKGADVIVLDLRGTSSPSETTSPKETSSWTDFFVIATASSNTHMDGLDRHISEFCADRGIGILRRSRKPRGQEDEWRVIDLGSVVIHLMSRRARDFYELERLFSGL